MKLSKYKCLTIAVMTSLALTGCEQGSKPEASAQGIKLVLDSEVQKVSYIMGMNIGSQIGGEAFDLDLPSFTVGVSDALGKLEPKLNEEDVTEVIEAFQARMSAEREAFEKLTADTNLKEGQDFLADNAKKEGVIVLESGLQYKVLEAGEGAIPTAESTVEVNYKGTLIDGTEFDSSFKRGVPAQFGVTQVIPAWVEALQLMKEGAKWALYVPSELAYGAGGTGGIIGPNHTLIFEVELLKAAVTSDSES